MKGILLDLLLSNQTAVVIGGAKGIGRAIAEAFAAEGARTVALDIDPAVVKTGEEIKGAGYELDATDYSAAKEQAEATPADHLVYAAGVGSQKYGFPFWRLEPRDWERVLRVNLIGAVNVAHAFSPHMVAQRSGTMLFLSSIAGQIGSQTDPPYSAAKAGVINFAQCAAKDLAEYNVRVNTICPGMIKTTVNESVWAAWHRQAPDEEKRTYDEWASEKVRKVAPLQRWQEPEDVGNLAVFLASERARNITGQTMNVDGGQVMHW